jgi:hypothetical protein
MNDLVRGLVIGIAVGLVGGLMIGAIISGLVREFAADGPVTNLIVNNAQTWGLILGALLGAGSAYRMLQNLDSQREE